MKHTLRHAGVFLALDEVGRGRKVRSSTPSKPSNPVPTAPGASTLLISLDGAMVHTARPEQGWHGGKVRVCARCEPQTDTDPEANERRSPEYGPREFCIGVESHSAFWSRLVAHARTVGLDDPSCQRMVVVGDGAHWIWDNLTVNLRLAGQSVIEILDFFHASESVRDVAHAVWSPDSAEATQWATAALYRLKHEGGAVLSEVWQRLPPLTAAAQAAMTKAHGYFTYHADRLDDPRYRAMGLPIGSGIIESACQAVLKQRECGSGMHWQEPHAQAMATLRALPRSGRWDHLWAHNPCAQLAPAKRQIAA